MILLTPLNRTCAHLLAPRRKLCVLLLAFDHPSVKNSGKIRQKAKLQHVFKVCSDRKWCTFSCYFVHVTVSCKLSRNGRTDYVFREPKSRCHVQTSQQLDVDALCILVCGWPKSTVLSSYPRSKPRSDLDKQWGTSVSWYSARWFHLQTTQKNTV